MRVRGLTLGFPDVYLALEELVLHRVHQFLFERASSVLISEFRVSGEGLRVWGLGFKSQGDRPLNRVQGSRKPVVVSSSV